MKQVHHPSPKIDSLVARSCDPKNALFCLFALDEAVEQGLQALRTLLGMPLLVILVIHKRHPKPRLVPLGPLKVVQQAPGQVRPDVDPVLLERVRHGLDVAVKVPDPEVVVQDRLERHVVLALDGRAVFRHVDLGVAVPLGQPVEQVAEPARVGPEPEGLRLLADAVAVLAVEERLEVAEEVVGGGLGLLVLDVVGRVVVHAVEIVGVLDERPLLVGKGGQLVAELLPHGLGVIPEVDGVGEPGNGKLDLAVAGLNVGGVLGIPRVRGVAVEGDANLAAVGLRLEVLPVGLDGAAVRDEHVVAGDPRLFRGIAYFGFGPVRRVAGGEEPRVVAQDGGAPRFVEGDPVRHLREGFEHGPGVILKIERELVAVEQTAVPLVEAIGQIPVEEGHEGYDARLEKVVNELDVKVDAGLVDGVVAASQRNAARPGDGEAVGLGAERFEEGNILARAVVRVAGYGA